MTTQQGQTNHDTNAFFKGFQRLWRCLKHLCQRYAAWREIKRQHGDLLRMDRRMLKDIGLSRADVTRIVRGHTFWRHMFQPQEGQGHMETDPKSEAADNRAPVQAHAASHCCRGLPGRSLSKVN